tara:strand:+ start:207 stop:518 length:312 start_codon:yes stop_codon:yes gene_type:complete
MESKKRNGIIILGKIIFIISIIAAISMIYVIVKEFYRDYFRTEGISIIFCLLGLSVLVGFYVKLTNYGIIDETELQKNTDEKKELKDQIEVAELKIKLKKLTE